MSAARDRDRPGSPAKEHATRLPERPPVIPIGSLESLGMALAQAQGLTERELNDWDGVRRLEQIRRAS